MKRNSSNKEEKHTNGIISMKDRQLLKIIINHSKQKKQSKLNPEDKHFIRQNSALLQDFMVDKLQIVKLIQLNMKGQAIINFCQKQNYEEAIDQIKQGLQFLQYQLINNFRDQKTNKGKTRETNQTIYNFLVQFSQFNGNLKEKLISVSQIQQQETFRQKSQSIIEKYSSPQILHKTKRSNAENSTNYLSRAKSQKVKRIKQFQEDFIKAEQQYVLTSDNNMIADPQTYRQDSLDEININHQNTEKAYSQQLNFEKLSEYFLAYIISLSAQNQDEYRNFLKDLLNQITFEDEFKSQSQSIIQQKMTEDHEYCIKILVSVLKNRFDRMIKNDKQCIQTNFIYFPKQINFLQLTHHFILANANQIIYKVKQFCQKVSQITQIIQKINAVTQQNAQSDLRQDNLIDALSKYLPKDQQKELNFMNLYTFSPKKLQNLKKNIQNNDILANNRHALSAAINVFKKIILKISFDRIKFCRRYDFQAVEAIFQTLRNSIALNCIMSNSLITIQKYSEQTIYLQNYGKELYQKKMEKLLKKSFLGWRKVRQRKMKLLRLLVRNKINLISKQQCLMFNRWRINISRQRIEEKIMFHSHSCSVLVKKLAQNQVQAFQCKQNKKNQAKQKNLSELSQIGMKRQSSLKNLSKSKINTSRLSKVNQSTHQKGKNDLKFLNYQYKQEILAKLNKQTAIRTALVSKQTGKGSAQSSSFHRKTVLRT